MKKGPTGGLLEFKAGKQEDAGAVSLEFTIHAQRILTA